MHFLKSNYGHYFDENRKYLCSGSFENQSSKKGMKDYVTFQ
jgi:hypothetical protein